MFIETCFDYLWVNIMRRWGGGWLGGLSDLDVNWRVVMRSPCWWWGAGNRTEQFYVFYVYVVSGLWTLDVCLSCYRIDWPAVTREHNNHLSLYLSVSLSPFYLTLCLSVSLFRLFNILMEHIGPNLLVVRNFSPRWFTLFVVLNIVECKLELLEMIKSYFPWLIFRGCKLRS